MCCYPLPFSRKMNYVYPPEILVYANIFYRVKGNRGETVDLSPLTNLEQLYLTDMSQIENLNNALWYLQKVHSIHIHQDTMGNILPFVKYLPNLRRLKIRSIENESVYNTQYVFKNNGNKVLNLTALSAERGGAGKLAIYVDEGIYVATKNLYTESRDNKVEVKRSESYGELEDFVTFFNSVG